MAVEGRDADSERFGDRGHGHVLVAHRLRRGDLPGCERRGSAADASSFAGCCDAGARALPDDLAFELRERTEDVEGEPPAAGGGVDVLGQRLESDLAGLELLDDLDQVLEAAAETVQAPDDERVARLQEREALIELRSLLERPGADVAEDASAASGGERVELQREVLLIGGDARVLKTVSRRARFRRGSETDPAS